MKICVIICTKDRPKDMTSLLDSFLKQSRKVDQIIIVDGSDNPISKIINDYSSLPIKYETLRPPGLTKQRNHGINFVNDDMDIIGFLDDDIVLEEKSFEELEKFAILNPDAGGFGMVYNNPIPVPFSIFRKIFLADKHPGGVVTISGVPSSIRSWYYNLKVEWIYGGACFWPRKTLSEFKYDEWYSGIGYMEDVDFSYRVSRKYTLWMVGASRCYHNSHPINKSKLEKYGAWLFVSWWYFSMKHKFNPLLIFWSMLGFFLSNILHGIFRPSSGRLLAAFGNLKGLSVIIRGQVNNFQGFQK
jgi:glycosyltransferase involved in cell wall biosynthesis